MCKERKNNLAEFSFSELTPSIELNVLPSVWLYEKAFLSREEETGSEWARNTTTWD